MTDRPLGGGQRWVVVGVIGEQPDWAVISRSAAQPSVPPPRQRTGP